MDFFKKVTKLSKDELKTIAVFCTATAVLVGAAVFLNAGVPVRLGDSLSQIPLLESSVATPFGVTQGVPEYDAPSPYKGGYPSPTSCNYGAPQCSPAARVATLSIHPEGIVQGLTVTVDSAGNVSNVGNTPTLFSPGPLVVEWACLPSQAVSKTCSNVYECGSWWNGSAHCTDYYPCGYNDDYANTSIGTNFSTGGTLIGTTSVTFPTGPTTFTYTLQCKNTNTNQTWTAAIPVKITSATLSLTANPMEVVSGGHSLLTWNTTVTTANSCTIVDSKGVIGAKGLGTDTSGNGNAWVLNSLSTADQTADSPTNNFATLNLANYYSPTGKGGVQAGGLAANGGYGAAADWQLNSGKWYWEFTVGGVSGKYPVVGLFKDTTSGFSGRTYPGDNNDSGIGYQADGHFVNEASYLSATPSTFLNGDVIGVAYDADTGKTYFSKNGVWQNSADPASGTGSVGKIRGGWPGLSSYYGKTYLNFGQGGAPSIIFYDSSGYHHAMTRLTSNFPQISAGQYKFGQTSAYFSSGALVTYP